MGKIIVVIIFPKNIIKDVVWDEMIFLYPVKIKNEQLNTKICHVLLAFDLQQTNGIHFCL